MSINLFYHLAFFMFFLIMSSFLLLDISPRNFKAMLKLILTCRSDSFLNTSDSVCI